MNLEKKGIICGAIWGILSMKYSLMDINPYLTKFLENTIYLPIKISSYFGELIFGYPSRIMLIIAYPFFIIETILAGAFIGYLIAKVILKIRRRSFVSSNIKG